MIRRKSVHVVKNYYNVKQPFKIIFLFLMENLEQDIFA